MDIGPLSAPYLLAPVLAMAQLVNVSEPGQQPDLSQPITEDMRLFDPSLTDSHGETSLLSHSLAHSQADSYHSCAAYEGPAKRREKRPLFSQPWELIV